MQLPVVGICAFLLFQLYFCLAVWRFRLYESTRCAFRFFRGRLCRGGAVLLFYLIYYGLKELVFNAALWKKIKENRGSKVVYIALSVLAWLFILIMLGANNAADFFIIVWAVVLPYALLMGYLNVKVLIPALPEKRPFSGYYLSRIIPVALLINFIATVFCMTTVHGSGAFIGAYFLLLVWTGLVVIPASWWFYRNQKENRD